MTLKSEALKITQEWVGEVKPSLIFAHPLDVEMETLVTKELSRMIDDMQESNTINIGEALRRMYIAGRNSIDAGVKMIVTDK